MMSEPKLMRSDLTGRVYIVTRYRDLGDGRFQATTKYEVPEKDLIACGLSSRPAPQPLDVERLARAYHEWSMANERQRCTAYYVPVRPCTPR